jgi:hypothetical protein
LCLSFLIKALAFAGFYSSSSSPSLIIPAAISSALFLSNAFFFSNSFLLSHKPLSLRS